MAAVHRLMTVITGILLPAVLPAQENKVGFRDDHTVLVGGRPFFPIGLYYCGEEFDDTSGKLLKELRDYGFNTLGFYRYGTPTWKTELDLAHKLGLKVWIRGHNGFSIDSAEVEKAVLEQVRELRRQPTLLFWEFQDEPLYNKVSVENSRKGYRLVKREDPGHPMLTVEWPGVPERFGEWKGIGDIFGTDLYPIPRERAYGTLPNHDITQMRDYIEALKKGHGDRPILMVLQAWAWDAVKDGEKGYPTVIESRFMAYQAVIHGACGLSYYGQFHCTKPSPAAGIAATSKEPEKQKPEFEKCLALNKQFWERHRGFFKELNQAAGIFVLPAAKSAERFTTSEGIESATRKSPDGELYLMAVNAGRKQRQTTFKMPAGSKVKEVHVLFEDRKLPVKEGAFTDTFRPYDTQVYGTTAKLPK